MLVHCWYALKMVFLNSGFFLSLFNTQCSVCRVYRLIAVITCLEACFEDDGALIQIIDKHILCHLSR